MNSEPAFLRARRLLGAASRSARVEPLECRIVLSAAFDPAAPSGAMTPSMDHEMPGDMGQEYPGGVRVTATHITTMSDTFPRFAAQPTITSVRSGPWSSPEIWSLGRVPTDGDRVLVSAGTSVLLTGQSGARISAIEVGGALTFSPVVNTRLLVGTLTVMPTGRLQIGTATAPIAAGVTAELVIADQPLDLDVDPFQLGTGLLSFGEVSMFGAPLSVTWTGLASEPRAGGRVLTLNDRVDWKPGDTLVLPDTRQVKDSEYNAFLRNELPPQWEEVVIDQVIGNRVFLKAPLQYDHLGAYNLAGQRELLPHVALLDRNLIVRSENAQGTRGHTLFTARSKVDIEFARFQDLGRTDAFRALDNTKVDEHGNVTHIGTNQIARYAVHFHHLIGPENPTNTGYQFKFIGNTVDRSKKWAVDIHGSDFGYVARNVVYEAQGAGIVTEDGTEIGNLIAQNIAIRVQGTNSDGKTGTLENDVGRGGSGFWFRRGGNSVLGNVAADTSFAGFVFNGYYTDEITISMFRGAMKHEHGQGMMTRFSPPTFFSNNEAYGLSRFGLWAAYISGNNKLENHPQTRIGSLRVWHATSIGVFAYHTADLVFDRLLVLGDTNAQTRNDTGTTGMELSTYENFNLTIRDSRIEGVRFGIRAPNSTGSTPGVERKTLIENSTLKNYINIIVSPQTDDRPDGGNVLEVRNVKFETFSKLPKGPISSLDVEPPANIWMRTAGKQNIVWTAPSIVRVYNYNQEPGNDFQVYYHEQAAGAIMRQTIAGPLNERKATDIGSPQAGWTNLKNWLTYGMATFGALAPNAAASHPEIRGLVGSFLDWSRLTPRVVLVTPWDQYSQSGGYMAVHYAIQGLMPSDSRLYFQLDGGKLLTTISDGGLFNLKPGQHTLTAFIGDANGQPVAGTIAASHTFYVTA